MTCCRIRPPSNPSWWRTAGATAAIEVSPGWRTTPAAGAVTVARFVHGLGAVSSGLYPDLRHADPATHDQWDAIVRGGLRTAQGMPSFADQLSAEDARAVRAYVLERAWHAPGLLERALATLVEHACLPASWITD